MARPRVLAQTLYRMNIARPERNDSVIKYSTKTLDELKQIYGDKLVSVQEYRFVGEVHK